MLGSSAGSNMGIMKTVDNIVYKTITASNSTVDQNLELYSFHLKALGTAIRMDDLEMLECVCRPAKPH